jgi:hypothetical protein
MKAGSLKSSQTKNRRWKTKRPSSFPKKLGTDLKAVREEGLLSDALTLTTAINNENPTAKAEIPLFHTRESVWQQ